MFLDTLAVAPALHFFSIFMKRLFFYKNVLKLELVTTVGDNRKKRKMFDVAATQQNYQVMSHIL